MNIMIAVYGMIGAILCVASDVLIGYMGDDNRKIGKRKNIDSNWSKLSQRRICLSFLLSLLGQPGTYLSVWAIGTLIGENNRNLEIILKIGIFVAAYTGLLLHAAFCIKPLVYKKIMEKQDFELAEGTLETIDKILFIPVVLGVISLAGVTTVCIIMGIVTGAVNVPKILVLLNPITFMLLYKILERINRKLVIPGPMGLGFLGYAVILLVAST